MKRYLAAATAVLALAAVPGAWAHAHVSPPVVVAKDGQLFTVDVPNEKDNAQTTSVELTPPEGFIIDSVVPVPGWKVGIEKSGSGEEAQINRVIWSGGRLHANEAGSFPFLASADSAKSYSFTVRQTYSDGTVVDWSGPESSDTPAPVVEAKSSLGGGGTSTISWIALALGAVALLLGILALAARGRGGARELA
jgi:uncharacterized protein YcnI